VPKKRKSNRISKDQASTIKESDDEESKNDGNFDSNGHDKDSSNDGGLGLSSDEGSSVDGDMEDDEEKLYQ